MRCEATFNPHIFPFFFGVVGFWVGVWACSLRFPHGQRISYGVWVSDIMLLGWIAI